MTNALDHQADQISIYAREVEQLENQLTYTSGCIASMAADGDTDSTVFTSLVAVYKTARRQHTAAKQAYNAALKGEN